MELHRDVAEVGEGELFRCAHDKDVRFPTEKHRREDEVVGEGSGLRVAPRSRKADEGLGGAVQLPPLAMEGWGGLRTVVSRGEEDSREGLNELGVEGNQNVTTKSFAR